ncbi:unnamed protein product [Brassicogethes aeneus]|nr:unnamed protein product [Brassicogethes aeneus]
MTDLESPRKNNDCYFYYYSTCAKGDSCMFRHEPSALGCETMCSFWKEGKCLNVHCNFRHMELRKNRKVIPCYWESQPGGCKKPHCPFMHQSKTDEENMEKSDITKEKMNADMVVSEKCQANENYKNSGVDSLVVNFEEESDTELAPPNSPNKQQRLVKVKTLEEIKLEKIQEESAAYYSYTGYQQPNMNADNLRKRIMDRLGEKVSSNPAFSMERRAQKRETETELENRPKKFKQDVTEIKIKTLAEIRAEKRKNQQNSSSGEKKSKIDESEVTSTSDTSESTKLEVSPKRKIKLRRRPILLDSNTPNSTQPEENPPEKTETHENVVTNSGEMPEEKLFETDYLLEEKEKSKKRLDRSDSNKTMDDFLLDDDEDDGNEVSIRAEEDLLNEIDSILDD